MADDSLLEVLRKHHESCLGDGLNTAAICICGCRHGGPAGTKACAEYMELKEGDNDCDVVLGANGIRQILDHEIKSPKPLDCEGVNSKSDKGKSDSQ